MIERSNYPGVIKSTNSDFFVKEIIDFPLTGQGEHCWLFIEKNGINTMDVIKLLAKHTGIRRKDIGYSGLKDKHAITQQWLSLHLPGKPEFNSDDFQHEKIKILKQSYHNKKLKVGTHKQNFFQIVIRDVIKDFPSLTKKLDQISKHGYMNKFGEQRFSCHNLQQALQLSQGSINVNKKDRGYLLSVLRSYLFNQYIDYRQQRHHLQKPLIGDIVSFIDGGSCFEVTTDNLNETQSRLHHHELSITAPLIGKPKKLHYQGDALTLYDAFCHEHQEVVSYLNIHTGMHFRNIYALPNALKYTIDQAQRTLNLSFCLPTGAFATSLLEAVNS